uniref:NADH-cytochrome b5 reductase 2 n=1 Tax=Anthurium amnicola TaxID=1678845 RepID=A0A1D1ZGJ3_9ARAE
MRPVVVSSRTLVGLSLACCLLLVLFMAPMGSGSPPPQRPHAGAACNGSIAQCLGEEHFLMDSETNRRMLQQRRYLTPNTFKPDTAVCDGGRAQRYNNCLPPSSNKPHRRCNTYERCR